MSTVQTKSTKGTTPPPTDPPKLASDVWREDDLVDVMAPERAKAWEETLDGFIFAGWSIEDPDEVGLDPTRVVALRTEPEPELERVLRRVPRSVARVMSLATTVDELSSRVRELEKVGELTGAHLRAIGRAAPTPTNGDMRILMHASAASPPSAAEAAWGGFLLRGTDDLIDPDECVDVLTSVFDQIKRDCKVPLAELLAEALSDPSFTGDRSGS